MAKNRLLRQSTVKDIDERVERVLRGLGNPEPPLSLADVRELLKLDRQFYTADDPGLIKEAISRIRVASIQVFQRPTILLDAIKKMSLKALYVPDRKRILLDGALPEKKHRWNEAHEIGHSLLPWHEDTMHGDNSHTLSRDCHEQIETEANFAAGRLLFLRDRFTEEALDLQPSISAMQSLHRSFGNTLSTTFYRFIETVGSDRPMVGLISGHPHRDRRAVDFDPLMPCRHHIRSPEFARRFSRIREIDLFAAIVGYCGPQRGGPLGSSELILCDDNGEQHRFYFETFFNRYDALTFGVHLRKEPLAVTVL